MQLWTLPHDRRPQEGEGSCPDPSAGPKHGPPDHSLETARPHRALASSAAPQSPAGPEGSPGLAPLPHPQGRAPSSPRLALTGAVGCGGQPLSPAQAGSRSGPARGAQPPPPSKGRREAAVLTLPVDLRVGFSLGQGPGQRPQPAGLILQQQGWDRALGAGRGQ